MIRHTNNELLDCQSCPDYMLKSQRFRVYLCKTRFLNLQNNNYIFKSLGKEHLLSEQLKNFSNLACEGQIMFINKIFKNNKPNSLLQLIPITAYEEAAALNKENMIKKELLVIIDSLLNCINLFDHLKYCGLQQKSHSQLQEILQNIRDLHKNQDDLENEMNLYKNYNDFENETELENKNK
ncbi:12510_t:CDS:1 [Cetraspora pellucida]|uniref:12510_t:CDS:1 n=1 Tax=Cetraspora pellucida TaxID=1433469 RepID=A0A9N9C2J3_9GLOM|nr:12510_t:CDS:1 [Cetraspora pellucida]